MKNEENKIEAGSLTVVAHNLGTSLLQAASDKRNSTLRDLAINSVTQLINEKSVLLERIEHSKKMIEIVERRLEAIEAGKFYMGSGTNGPATIFYNDTDLNTDHSRDFIK